ncbi:MAG: aminopeptidase [Anaerolinea sp.]|nr:aminopeptidase [Anaerolinea sp.]
MNDTLLAQQRAYADLIIRSGINLQPGQSVAVRAELGHRDFVRILAEVAYAAGARQVEVLWVDPLVNQIRYQQVQPEYLGFVPEFEVARAHEFLDEGWARVALTGEEYPDALENVPPAALREYQQAWYKKLGFFQQRMMNNDLPWCVAGVPMAPWAQKIFPDLDAAEATERLWELVLRVCRADQPDPNAAWQQHDANLKKVVAFMQRNDVRAVRFLDQQMGPDGQAATDLTVGLTDRPNWISGSSYSATGVSFFANIPTEEAFCTPHRERTEGWVRTSKPGFPFQREVLGAWFRFEQGQVVEWRAEKGQEVLDELFQIPGARRLGEVALVDVRSPINQSGRIFYNTLFDENAVCHIAFGRAYPEGIQGGSKLSDEELDALGLNSSETHNDLMIGAATMQVIGTCADGSEVVIMENGMFVDTVLV